MWYLLNLNLWGGSLWKVNWNNFFSMVRLRFALPLNNVVYKIMTWKLTSCSTICQVKDPYFSGTKTPVRPCKQSVSSVEMWMASPSPASWVLTNTLASTITLPLYSVICSHREDRNVSFSSYHDSLWCLSTWFFPWPLISSGLTGRFSTHLLSAQIPVYLLS